ncbi:MAG: hypothetical protein HY754_15080 [Nitrospirae bacterium]|nr:hypothetical protein [Nitrospirota bacterium]
MSVDTLKIYEILAANLPESQAKAVAKAIDEAIEADTERKKEILVTKEDLHSEVSKLEKEIARLEIKIESTKSEIIKWMFIFWLGQIVVLSGIIFAMLKLYFK